MGEQIRYRMKKQDGWVLRARGMGREGKGVGFMEQWCGVKRNKREQKGGGKK